MAATSEERREVAARLRQASHTDADFDLTIAIAILDTIGEVHRPIAAVVADLIDPTCILKDATWDDGTCTWGCICSACGAKLEYEHAQDLAYCPDCGARNEGARVTGTATAGRPSGGRSAMARDDDESTPRSPMTYCEMFEWFFGKSRFTTDARPDRCAKCPAQMRSSTQEEKNLYENMLARMSTPIDVDIFAYDDVTAHAAECVRRCGSDGEGD